MAVKATCASRRCRPAGHDEDRKSTHRLTGIRKAIYCVPNMTAVKPDPVDTQALLPLSPATLHVLMALTGGELHGYGILLEVQRQSGGQYKMGPGTLYDNIKKLLRLRLVETVAAARGEDEERRRYRLTRDGRAVLAAETERLTGVLREARRGLRLLGEKS
jgi:DNA-binding PadR family transcriptional regulator